MASMAKDLGLQLRVRLHTDSSALNGVFIRRGIGRIRLLHMPLLWVQQERAVKASRGDRAFLGWPPNLSATLSSPPCPREASLTSSCCSTSECARSQAGRRLGHTSGIASWPRCTQRPTSVWSSMQCQAVTATTFGRR